MTLPGADFPESARSFIEQLFAEPLLDAADLRAEVDTHRKLLREAHLHRPEVQYVLGDRLAEACLALVWMVRDDTSVERRHLIQAAVHYFTLDSDARGDFASRGLDDDRLVVNAVCRHLGRDDLLVSDPDAA